MSMNISLMFLVWGFGILEYKCLCNYYLLEEILSLMKFYPRVVTYVAS